MSSEPLMKKEIHRETSRTDKEGFIITDICAGEQHAHKVVEVVILEVHPSKPEDVQAEIKLKAGQFLKDLEVFGAKDTSEYTRLVDALEIFIKYGYWGD